jgi:hypothetical protein
MLLDIEEDTAREFGAGAPRIAASRRRHSAITGASLMASGRVPKTTSTSSLATIAAMAEAQRAVLQLTGFAAERRDASPTRIMRPTCNGGKLSKN